MKKIVECILFLPALIFWIPFALCFRFGNCMKEVFKIKGSKTDLWFWFNIEAKDHVSYYDNYSDYDRE